MFAYGFRVLAAAAFAAVAIPLVGLTLNGQAATSPQDPQSPPAASAQPPTFRAGVNFVRVDVIVTDNRNERPIADLKAGDFEITEAGKPQKIETFKLVSLDGGLTARGDEVPRAIRSDDDEAREAARDDVRVFAMVLDDYHVKRGSSLTMRGQLARFVETQLGPSDLIALMHPLDPIETVRLTRNLDEVRRGILQFEGRKHDYFPKNDGEARCVFPLLANLQVDRIEQLRNQIAFDALKSLITRLAVLKEGRKSLVLVSEGYSNSLPEAMRAYGGGLATGIVGANGPVPTGCSSASRTDLQLTMDLQDIFNLANRNNVSIYTVDPRGLAASEYGMDLPEVDRATDRRYLASTMETLQVLAENSNGRAIVNRNDLTIAMKPIVVDASAYYLLGYNSTVASPDGKFHEISVKVKRTGVQVRRRKGYWALKPDEFARVLRPAPAVVPSMVEAALTASDGPRSRVIRTWIGSQRSESAETRMTFVWEPTPSRAGEPLRPSQRPARVLVTGTVADGSSAVRRWVPETATASSATAGFRLVFDAPPGRLRLRLSVEGASGDVLDSEVRDLVVPDYTPPLTLLGTPELYRARSASELQRLKTDPQPVPTAARDFGRAERLLVRVPVYGPAGTAPTMTARLLNRRAGTIADLSVSPADRTHPFPQLEVSLANLAAGDYGIALTATGEGGEASEVIAFRITP